MNNIQNKRFFKNGISILTIAIPMVILMLPILGLAYGAALKGGGQDILSRILPTSRSLNLFIRSILISSAISVTDILIAILASLGLYKLAYKHEKVANVVSYVSIFMLLLPSFTHSEGWWRLFEALGLSSRGLLPAWWVSVMYYLPLPVMLIFISLKAMDKDVLEAGTVFLNPRKVLLGVIFPSIYPAVFGSGLLVFLLSLADYSIVSIFSVNVYALDIFAQFSVAGSVADALFYSLPLILVTVIVGILGFRLLKGISLTAKGEKGKGYVHIILSRLTLFLSGLGLCILLGSIIVPSVTLISSVFNGVDVIQHILMSTEEFTNTILISFSTLLISMPLSLVIGAQLNRKILPGVVYFMLAIPIIMPSPLIGIGLIGIFNGTYMYNTVAMPVLASVIRYTPVGAILCFSGFKGLDKEILSARLVYQKSVLDGFFKLVMPMVLPVILMSGFIAFILSTGEIGATIMVLPPGVNTLAIKIYNYLHYGASDGVAVLCIALAIFAATIGGIVFFVVSLFRKGRD